MKKMLALALAMLVSLCAFASAEPMPVAVDMLTAVDIPIATAVPLTTVAPDAFEAVALSETDSPSDAQGEWQNILLMGGDSRSTDAYERTDSMIIISFNREESLLKMTSIMRDTWVHIPGHGNNKINAANVFGGPELAVRTVNENFGTDIEDYVIVNMDDMENIVNLLGGVDLEITESERNQINEHENGGAYLSNAGMVHLNGAQAVTYSRIRYIDSDYQRVMRQQRVLLAIADKAQNMDVDELSAVAADVYENVLSSLTQDELEDLATAFMVMEVDEVEQFRVPADNTFESGTYNGVWCIRPNFDKNRAKLHAFIYGE